MSSRSTLRIILTAMFAALICVATMFTQIPILIPGAGGYANAGDGLMLTAAFLLPPGCAAIAGGVAAAGVLVTLVCRGVLHIAGL